MSRYNKEGIALALLTIIVSVLISVNWSPLFKVIVIGGNILWVIFLAYLEWRRQK